MGQQRDTPFVARLPIRAVGIPALPKTDQSDGRLEIAVIYTSAQATVTALNKAAALAKGLRACLRLVMLNVVPYPLPLESPPVRCDFSKRHLLEIASLSPLETTVHLCMCRQQIEALLAVLLPHSLVVIGGRTKWRTTKEEKLAKKLRHAGHEVILALTGA